MRDVAVPDWIEMNIIHVCREVGIVADGMFPEPPLPDAALPVPLAYHGAALLRRQAAGKDALDHAPSRREVIVSRRQRPDAMQMVWQDDPGIDGERPGFVDGAHGRAQAFDVARQQNRCRAAPVRRP